MKKGICEASHKEGAMVVTAQCYKHWLLGA